MEIVKYKKKKNNKYLITLSNGDSLELFEEVILKNNLLIKKDIDSSDINFIINDQQFYSCYYDILKMIRVRPRSIYEVKTKMIKDKYDEELVLDVIEKVKKQGYLDDKLFATSYINNQIITTNHGPRRISSDLKKKGVSSSVINEVISIYDNYVEEEKVSKIIDKMIKSNRNKGNNYLRRKIYNDLLRDGFSKSIVDKVISSKEFGDDSEIKAREYEKIKARLQKKYSGNELEYKINDALIKKGFNIN